MPTEAEVVNSVIDDLNLESRSRLTRGMDGDKKKAAESYRLSGGTNTDPNVIYSDLDRFKRKYKSEAGNALIENDPNLNAYLRNNPLAATVSQDDWGPLSLYSDKVRDYYDIAARHFPVTSTISRYGPSVARGLYTGIMQQNPEMFAGFLEAQSYNVPSFMQGPLRNTAGSVREFAKTGIPAWAERRTKSMEDIDSLSYGLEWAFESLGLGVASTAPSAAAGATGFLAGTAIGGPAVGVGGAAIGAMGVGYAMAQGELYDELVKAGVPPEKASLVSSGGAIPIAALDATGLGMLAKIGLGPAKKEIARSFARTVAKAIAEGAATEALTEGSQELIQNIIVNLASGKPWSQDMMKGVLESAVVGGLTGGVMTGGIRVHTENKQLYKLRQVLNDINRTVEDVEPWLRNGEAIPHGANRNVDQLIALHSLLKIDAVDAFIDAANKTETKELSTEAFQELAGQQFGEDKAYIRWDAVKAIYGDEMPTPNDGKLGWIEDIERKFKRSQQFGEPIEVRLADLVAADKEAYKLIENDFFVEDGVTRKDAEQTTKHEPETTQIHESELPGLSEDLRRPFVLKDIGEGSHEVIDENGNKTAEIKVIEREGGKNLFVGWEKGQYDPAGLITVLNQLKHKYPNAETISTVRIPGVRSLERLLDAQGQALGVEMPFRIKERPVDTIRRAMGIEPMFDLPDEGPREIRLVPGPAPEHMRGQLGFQTDDYTITDESGRPIASLEVKLKKGGKELFISWIGDYSQHKEGAEKPDLMWQLGPKLIFSMARQIHQIYPDVEEISGVRVTGARLKAHLARSKLATEEQIDWEHAGVSTWSGTRVTIKLKDLLDEAENWPAGWHPLDKPLGPETERFFQLISEGYRAYGKAMIKPAEGQKMSLEQMQFMWEVNDYIEKVIGKGKAQVLAAEQILKDIGTKRERATAGLFQFAEDVKPFIHWSFESPDPYATGGHEAIHFLRTYQIITDAEWATLKKAADERGWLDRPEMIDRYGHFRETNPELYYEEAIADEFKRWSKMDRENQQLHGMAKFFQKILDLIDKMKSVYRQVTGKQATADQIMRDIQLGMMAGREMGPIQPEKLAMPGLAEELPAPLEEKVPTFAPGAVMDKKKYAQYQRLMNNQNEEDIAKERRDAVKEANRRNAPEWKKNREEMRKDVESEIGRRPDARARAFFQNGVFYGQETHYMPKVDPRFLTKEQRAQFPARWQEKGGMNPDDLAQPFGFQTGSGMVDALIRFEAEKGKLTPKEFLDKMVDQETDRRMQQKYGDLAQRNLEEAMDHVVGNTQMDLIHEEMLALAARAGMQLTISKDDVKAMAFSAFLDTPQTDGTYKYFMRELYRAGKASEAAFLKGDYITAFNEKWMQVHLFEMARSVKQLEKEKAQLQRVAKRFKTRYPDGFPAEFTEFIQLLLTKAGFEVDRGPGDLKSMMTLGARVHQGDLKKFVEYHNELPAGFEDFEGALEPYLIIPDFILDNPDWGIGGPAVVKPLKNMNVGELKALNDALQSLQKIGADQAKLHRLGEEADLQRELKRAKDQLYAVGPEKPVKRPGKRKNLAQWYHKGTLRPEDLFLRLDKGDEDGFFTQFLTDPLNDRAYFFDQMHKDFRKKRIEIDKKYGGTTNRSIPNNVFVDPTRLQQDEEGKIIPPRKRDYIPATHQMLRTVLLNWGNKSNRERLTEGHFIENEALVDKWLKDNATEKDWQWAKAIGELYEELYKHSSEVTMRESNTMVERIPLPQIDTPFGKMDGWYYPIHYDRSKDGGPKRTEVVAPPRLVRTYRGWERKRTGPAGPLDLTIDPLDLDMNRRIHDIAYREVLRDMRKIIKDRGLRQMMEKHMGRMYVEMLDNLHDDIALPYRPNSGALQGANRYIEAARQNVIMTLVGFNLGTFLKHVPSTAVQSWGRLGLLKMDFWQSAVDLFMTDEVSQRNTWMFVTRGGKVGNLETTGSREINRRWKHYAQAHGLDSQGMTDLHTWFSGVAKAREKMIDWSSRPVAAGDMVSSVILWNAVYKKLRKQYMEEGMTIEQAHVKADTRADMAVRQTHGSTSIVSRPEFMRRADSFSRWFTSLFAYYNHVYGQMYRMMWRSKDVVGERYRKETPTQTVLEYASEMANLNMTYIILPAAFYWMAQDFLLGKDDDDEDNLAWKIAKPVLHNVGGAFLGVRDVMGFLSGGGQQPTPGIIGVPLQSAWNLARNFDPEKEWKETDPGKVLRYAHSFAGVAAGLSSNQVGMWNQFIYNYMQAIEEPETSEDWYRAVRRGTIERRKK